ncbi:MAG TPA: ABC transporter ATP-binding protein [Gemmatimonadaceae bacterium]
MSTTRASGDVAVHVDAVTKRYGDVVAVDAISLDVAHGEIFGFIGPDGAGKTTLFRMLVTLLVPDSGTATVLGDDVVRDLWSLRQRVGYMPGRFSLYPDLTVAENLDFFASVFGTTVKKEYDRIAPIYTQIEPFNDRRAGALSGGMKQKLALCCALVHKPDILFLDEPTTGVDAVSRREFWDLLGKLKADALTIVVSTPYMDEADRCDRVALMQGGHILAIDTPSALTASFDRPLLAVSTAKRYEALKVLRETVPAQSAYPFGESLHVVGTHDQDATAFADDLTSRLHAKGIDDARVSTATPTIEDLFIARMGMSNA